MRVEKFLNEEVTEIGEKPESRLVLFFISISMIFLFVGMLFGVIGSLQYIFPAWLREAFSFATVRPLHVSLVISWIFTAATGGVYYYIQDITGRHVHSIRLAWLHAMLLLFVSICTFVAYSMGKFGGREYLEFPPWLGVPIVFYWVLFMFNFFKTIRISLKTAPIYIWMWATGLVFFLITFLESQLWLIGFFGENIIRDTTVQWKALGSMVGSWNMLVYGTAFYVMEKISGNSNVANSKQTFFFYFLGLTNLMFNWGHHTYIVPASPLIRNIAYIISMTELLILANIIRQWRSTLDQAKKNIHHVPYRFLLAADFWIFFNLMLAIAISIPAINLYTHGTHITVAHAMGTTIGINTMILFASITYLVSRVSIINFMRSKLWIIRGFWLSNFGLVFFWILLLFVGFKKALNQNIDPHNVLFEKLMPFFGAISFFGIIILIGFSLLIFPLTRLCIRILFENRDTNS
ncbi:MAG TPA: cbb3-type cytochrome c oxidase subunit I [Bacteroidia bacterium]|nr:cbb3-type cytochrome c oxidase subunit I [Bacteroidia bacterium]